jgi:hypothetical protein
LLGEITAAASSSADCMAAASLVAPSPTAPKSRTLITLIDDEDDWALTTDGRTRKMTNAVATEYAQKKILNSGT